MAAPRVLLGALVVASAISGCDWPLCEQPCGDGKRCVAGRCVEGPCGDRQCGPDGQGGSCGACAGRCEAGQCRACPTDTVFIGQHGGDAVCIDRYEASKGASGEAVSRAAVQPWRRPTWLEAADACKRAGKRLCTNDEWTAACTGGEACAPFCRGYPYGKSFEQGRCYGAPLASDPEPTGPVPTGSKPDCEGGFPGIFDLSGNLAEWLDDCDSSTCSTAGGGYDDWDSALRCSSRTNEGFGVRAPDWVLDQGQNIGFRCCRSL